ncbi:MAG: glycosyltransferase family 2 protein, partial [Flavobacteriales bacterium]
MSRIAIVILNWNGEALLEQFLPSVTKFSIGADIYVADNASTDNSIAFIKEQYP